MMQIKRIGIVGAGQMGRGIAQVAMMSGFDVTLFDVDKENANFAQQFIQKQLKKGVEKGKRSQSPVDESLVALTLFSDINSLADCDLLIEAATENKSVKFEIFKQLDEIAKPDAILATNTSSISITEIAAVTNRAKQVAGMHFMNPVPVMKLVEGIRRLETSYDVFLIKLNGFPKKWGRPSSK